jgi:4-hydroxythreonine-4-phosphate dehydrogenase
MSRLNIIITCGDVNGIGLRCLARAVEHFDVDAQLQIVISPDVLRQCVSVYRLGGEVLGTTWRIANRDISIEPLTDKFSVTPGTPSDAASRMAVASLERALDRTRSGAADCIVTLPVSKHALQRVGWPYPGQTEMVATYASGDPMMVLCTRDLHVALATVHVPLRDVASLLSAELIVHRIHQLHDHLQRRIGIDRPRLALLGLNPHASEGGRIGDEDVHICAPAVDMLRQSGIDVSGPFPADGFFGFGSYQHYDGVLAMYHDQGLIPLKLLAKGAGVNVTAGLSIIRTSPDHGTAYDMATVDEIDAQSTRLALQLACEMVVSQK